MSTQAPANTQPVNGINRYQLHYPHKTVRRYFRSLELCLHYINRVLWNDNVEPSGITLPSNQHITYNSTLAHYFAAEGRISEQQFIEYSKTAELVTI